VVILRDQAEGHLLCEMNVKNGFSDLTKEQVCQDQQRKDVMNDHQEKFLKRAVVKENGLR